jgi:hypothetical protein
MKDFKHIWREEGVWYGMRADGCIFKHTPAVWGATVEKPSAEYWMVVDCVLLPNVNGARNDV